MSIFRAYDIRGHAETDLPDPTAQTVARAIGTLLATRYNQTVIYVGRDNRLSSERLQRALTAGLVQAGMTVYDIGLVSTPNLYWYAAREKAGGVMVTGSHLDGPYNGFKICNGTEALHGEQIQALAAIIRDNAFHDGEGSYRTVVNSRQPYIDDLLQKNPVSRQMHIVVDAGNGTAGLYAPDLLRGWGQQMTGINLEPDGNFPNHPPNPSKAANVSQLQQAVRNTGADLGLIFDGDADRVLAVKHNGAIIQPDRYLALLAQDVLTRYPGATIIGDVTCSQALFDVIAQHGGHPLMSPTGHSLVKARMREYDSILAGEISGHIFFAEDYYGFDDAYMAVGKLLGLLSRKGQSLAQMDAALPHYFSSKVYRPRYAGVDIRAIVAALKHDLTPHAETLIELDGVRAQFPAGWAIIRASNTEPVLSIRIEGKTRADAERYRRLLVNSLRAFPQVTLADLTEPL